MEFTRRLYHDVATTIADVPPDHHAQLMRTRIFAARVRSGAVAVVLSVVLVFLDVRDAVPDDFEPSTWSDRVGPWTALAVLLAFYGGGAVMHGFMARLHDGSRSGMISPAGTRAREALEYLTWDVEQGQKSKNLVKILGGVLGAEDEDSLTLRRRTLSHPELVASFRGLLEEYSREPDSPSFLVFIDELDKMSEAEQLIEVVNGLKDLFHIPGVHFIVSVSTDALARFEQRGVPLRDAFDSAFDTVLRVERLSYQESLTLIDARAAGFPPVLALLCHAWSGGLPRDLLRAARRCVEVQRSEPIALPLATIQRHLVLGDLLSLTESLLRSGPTIVSQGNDAGLDAAIGSSHLRQAVRSVQAEVTTVDSAFRDLASALTASDVRQDRILGIGRTAFALLASFERLSAGRSSSPAPTIAEMGQLADVFAHAIAVQGDPPALRTEAATEAVDAANRAGLLPVSDERAAGAAAVKD